MKEVVKTSEAMMWESAEPHVRIFGLMFERDITPTRNLAAGIVRIPVGQEQPKLSYHAEAGPRQMEVEEIYFVVRGRGKFFLEDRVFDIESGTAVYVAPGVGHRAVNTGDEELELYFVTSPPVFGPVGGYLNLVKGWKRIR